MARLDKERQIRLEPKRKDKALEKIKSVHPLGQTLGLKLFSEISENSCKFLFKGEFVTYFYYSGWATGKSIKDGRGLSKLLKQLK